MNKGQVEILVKLRDEMSKTLGKIGANTKSWAAGIKASVASVGAAFAAGALVIQKYWAAILVVVLAINPLYNAVRGLIVAAQEQERATATLNAALVAQGQYTKETSQAIQDLATEYQNLFGIGDEVTLGIATQIEALTGLSGDALQKAIKAMIQFSNVTGADLNNAALLVAKTLQSPTNALQRYGVVIDATADKETKLNASLAATVAGWEIALAKAETYSGKVSILSAAYGDLQEALGFLIINNPQVLAAINAVAKGIIDQTKSVYNSTEQWAQYVSNFVSGVVTIVASVMKVSEGVKLAAKFIGIGVAMALSEIERLAATVGLAITTAMDDAAIKLMDLVNGIIDLLNFATQKVAGFISFFTRKSVTGPFIEHVTFDQFFGWNAGQMRELQNEIEVIDASMSDMMGRLDNATADWQRNTQAIEANAAAIKGATKNIKDYTDIASLPGNPGVPAAGAGGEGGAPAIGETAGAAVAAAAMKGIREGLTGGAKTIKPTIMNYAAAFAAAIHSAMVAGANRLGVAQQNRPGAPGGKPSFGQNILGSLMQQIRDPQFGANLGQALMQGGGGLADLVGGLGGGAISSAVSGIASLGSFAGPLGMLAGTLFTGLFGGIRKLFGGGRKQQEQPKPVDVRVVNSGDIAMALLNAVKTRLIGAAAPGNASLAQQLHAGAMRVNAL